MIHKYIFKDIHLILDVNSGAVHIVDPLIYDMMDYYTAVEGSDHWWVNGRQAALDGLNNKYLEEDILEAAREIEELAAEGMLFTPDEVQVEMIEEKTPVIKAMCLHVAHDCNMNCSYCFGDTGAFEGIRSLMTFATGKKALEFLVKQSGNRHNLEVDFFGGEPLMNFPVVKELVNYGRELEKVYDKNIRFTITTNGLLLNEEKTEYFNEVMDNVILSIDGRPDINDRMRPTIKGTGTYDIISKNYKEFIQKREGLYYVRGTFTRYNLDFASDVKHLVDEGFKNVSVEPVVTDLTHEYALRDEDLAAICQEYQRLADLYIEYAQKGQVFDFFHFNVDLNQGPCVIKRVSGCGAGTEYVAISPEGDIYPCHQFVGNSDFKIGNLNDTSYENLLFDTFNHAHIYKKEECMTCWAKFYCSGGCHANAYNTNQNILQPYELGCHMEKKRVECAIGIQAYLDNLS